MREGCSGTIVAPHGPDATSIWHTDSFSEHPQLDLSGIRAAAYVHRPSYKLRASAGPTTTHGLGAPWLAYLQRGSGSTVEPNVDLETGERMRKASHRHLARSPHLRSQHHPLEQHAAHSAGRSDRKQLI